MEERTVINIVESTTEGIDQPTGVSVDATNGMEFQNSGNEVLYISNSGTAADVTIKYRKDAFGREGNKVVTVESLSHMVIGPFLPDLYCHDNKVLVDFSSADLYASVIRAK